MPDVCCLLSAVHHLDSALLHPGGGHSPYRNSVACPEECKHSLSNRYYSCTAHFSTKIVPTDIKKARKRPFYRFLRAFENYSNSVNATGFQGGSAWRSIPGCFCGSRIVFERGSSLLKADFNGPDSGTGKPKD